MTAISIELPEQFNHELTESLRIIYLEAMEQARRDASVTKKFLTIEEVMQLYSVSRGTITKWIENGLPISKLDNKRYIEKEDLHDYIRQYKQ